MIPRDLRNNRQRNVVLVTLDINGDSGLVKGGVDAVDGDGVVRIRRVATDVDDDTQSPPWARSGDLLLRQERRYGRTQIDAVDKYVSVQDLLERTALRSLLQVPLQDIVPANRSAQ